MITTLQIGECLRITLTHRFSVSKIRGREYSVCALHWYTLLYLHIHSLSWSHHRDSQVLNVLQCLHVESLLSYHRNGLLPEQNKPTAIELQYALPIYSAYRLDKTTFHTIISKQYCLVYMASPMSCLDLLFGASQIGLGWICLSQILTQMIWPSRNGGRQRQCSTWRNASR
jgi:hypothetical protein